MAAMRSVVRCVRGCLRPRALTSAERAFVAREFGASLDPDMLRLAGGGQPTGRPAWQPLGALIQVDDAYFEDGDPEAPLRTLAYPMLAHEALHVWQRQHKQCAVNVSLDGLWLGATRGHDAYRYDRSITCADEMLRQFLAANIEQQGQMFEDYVRSSIEEPDARDPRYLEVARYVRSAG